MFDFVTEKFRRFMGSFSQKVDTDPYTGIETHVHYDAAEDKLHFESRADVTDLLELNKAQYNRFDERARWGESFATGKCASIPLHVYFDLKRKGIADDQEAFARWLDDPANLRFRTRPGRVSRRPRRR